MRCCHAPDRPCNRQQLGEIKARFGCRGETSRLNGVAPWELATLPLDWTIVLAPAPESKAARCANWAGDEWTVALSSDSARLNIQLYNGYRYADTVRVAKVAGAKEMSPPYTDRFHQICNCGRNRRVDSTRKPYNER
jgi:hypothetical protein